MSIPVIIGSGRDWALNGISACAFVLLDSAAWVDGQNRQAYTFSRWHAAEEML